MDLKHFSKTVVGLVRKANEDYIGFLTNDQTNGNGDIFVVCDGMGGHVGGATASKKAVECILEYFKNETHPNPILALEKAISFANEQIFLFSQDNPVLKGMGTTCTALLQKDDNVYIAHVGDSRIYLNTDSKLYRVTKDHSFVQKLVDAGQLADSEMENHPRKNELTRALGISSNVEVEVSEKPLIVKNGDKFLMCSDGLCGLVNDPTISHIINKEKGFKAVEELIQLALNAGGNDNISVGIIDVVSSPHLKTVFKDQTNNRSNLLETQVFDASAFKKDRNLFYILNRYKYYVLSFVIITILSIYLFSSDLIVIKQPSADKSNEGKIGLSIIDSTNIDSLVKKKSNSSSIQKIIKSSNDDKIIEIELKNTEKEKKSRKAEEERKSRELEERKSIEAEKNSLIKNNLKNAVNFVKKIKNKIKNFKGGTLSGGYISVKNKLKVLEEDIKSKKTNNLIDYMNDIETKWQNIVDIYNDEQSIKITNAKAPGTSLLKKLEKKIIGNKIYSDYVKDEINALENSFKTNDISTINEKTKDLENIINELDDRILSEKTKFIVYQPYKWDLKKCGIESDSHFGKGKMYSYKDGDKEINIVYLKETKEINSLKEQGYEYSNKKENSLKKNIEDEVIVSYKIFFTKEKFGSKASLNRLIECSGETKNQIYIKKKLN
tara:strand:- start:145 stop:2139 length:1995 start_codon:yes stop_codon:yes gene_type:complete